MVVRVAASVVITITTSHVAVIVLVAIVVEGSSQIVVALVGLIVMVVCATPVASEGVTP